MNKLLFFAFAAAIFACGRSSNTSPICIENGFAIGGYDVVAYFEEQPVRGDEELSYEWNHATWLFSSADHLESFKNDPEKYAPQYGGYCAYGCSNGYKATTEPDAWTLVDGKLYLNYNKEVKNEWMKDREALIEKADKNWPNIKHK